MMRRWISELVGTFALVSVYVCAYAQAPVVAPLVIGGALALLVHLGSGGAGLHMNPAVSVGLMLRGRLPEGEALRAVVAQLAGATLGAWSASAALGEGAAALGVYGFNPEVALLVEVLFAWALVLVALRGGAGGAGRGDPSHALVVGVTMAIALTLGGPISGGAFNPAIGFAPVLAAIGRAPIGHAWIFVVGPLVGAALAVLTERALHPAASSSGVSILVGEECGRSGEFLDPCSPPVDIVGRIYRRRAGQARGSDGGRRRR